MQGFRALLVVAGGVVAVATVGLAARAQSRDAPIPHDTGQSVTPSFEGWYENADGTFSLSFGYMNRNYEQDLDIPVGPDNRFEPGPADRGQPTHFLGRRHTGVFTVVVPADFGDQTLTWTLTSGGETIGIPGRLRPEWRIDALHEVTSGNRPPTVRFDPAGKPGQGPGGTRADLEVTLPGPLALEVWATDDGVKKRPSERPPQLGLEWSQYRGPAPVVFDDERPRIDRTGKARTTATFSEPGDYVLRVLAWDDSGPQGQVMAGGFQCCWTNGFVNVKVRRQ